MATEHPSKAAPPQWEDSFDEMRQVRKWRYDTLREVGYSRVEARLVADSDDIDLHLAVELVQHGCSHKTALDILT